MKFEPLEDKRGLMKAKLAHQSNKNVQKLLVLIRQPNVGFEKSLYIVFYKKACNVNVVKKTSSDLNDDAPLNLKTKQIIVSKDLGDIDTESKSVATVENIVIELIRLGLWPNC